MQIPPGDMERGRAAIDRVIELERALLSPDVRASRQRLGELLHEDFREIGASGRFWNRDELIEVIADAGPLVALDASEFEGSELAPGMVLVAWRSTFKDRIVRRSSLWRHYGSGWRLLFHQGTPVPAAGSHESADLLETD